MAVVEANAQPSSLATQGMMKTERERRRKEGRKKYIDIYTCVCVCVYAKI
jgi:hypothetical protein